MGVLQIVHSGPVLLHLLVSALPAADPVIPIDPEPFIRALFTWVTRIAAAMVGFFLVLDLLKHLAASPRDLRAIGIEIITTVVLVGVIAKAEAIVAWGRSIF